MQRHIRRADRHVRVLCGEMLAMATTPVMPVVRGAHAPRSTAMRSAWRDARSPLGDVVRQRRSGSRRCRGSTPSALFDPDSVEDPLLRQAMKEPVAFFGGMFAGFLGLSVDDKDSPLSRWVETTAEAAGRKRPAEARATVAMERKKERNRGENATTRSAMTESVEEEEEDVSSSKTTTKTEA